MDPQNELERCIELADLVEKAVKPFIGSYEDRIFQNGATGDATYEIDVPAERAVAEFFSSQKDPARVMTEDAGIMEFGSGPMPTYLIDPLDGSRNARRGLPLSCISIAVYPEDASELSQAGVSLIRRLDADETYHAISGEGAYLNGKRIHPSEKKSLTDAIICLGSHFSRGWSAHSGLVEGLLRMSSSDTQDAMIKCYGSTALELAYLASGRVDAVIDLRAGKDAALTPKTYDIAAGAQIAVEAGARLSYGNQKIPQKLPIDPHIPVKLIGCSTKTLFSLINKCIR